MHMLYSAPTLFTAYASALAISIFSISHTISAFSSGFRPAFTFTRLSAQ